MTVFLEYLCDKHFRIRGAVWHGLVLVTLAVSFNTPVKSFADSTNPAGDLSKCQFKAVTPAGRSGIILALESTDSCRNLAGLHTLGESSIALSPSIFETIESLHRKDSSNLDASILDLLQWKTDQGAVSTEIIERARELITYLTSEPTPLFVKRYIDSLAGNDDLSRQQQDFLLGLAGHSDPDIIEEMLAFTEGPPGTSLQFSPILVKLLSSTGVNGKLKIIEVLDEGAEPEPYIVNALIDLCEDPDDKIRANALQALKQSWTSHMSGSPDKKIMSILKTLFAGVPAVLERHINDEGNTPEFKTKWQPPSDHARELLEKLIEAGVSQ